MKKLITIIALAVAALSAGATEAADTVVTYFSPDKVCITEGSDGMAVTVTDGGKKDIYTRRGGDGVRRTSQNWTWLRGGDSGWDLTSGGVTLGFVNTPGAPEAAGFEAGKSLEIGMLNILALVRELPYGSLSLGVGVDWRNYRSTTGTMFTAEDGKVGVTAFAPGTDYRFSRLKVFSLQFPLLYNCRLTSAGSQPVFLRAGAILNWNSHGSIKSAWRDAEGGNVQTVSNDIGQRKFTVDFMASVGVGFVGLYVRYSPYKVLTGASAPRFTTLSAGVTMMF